MQKLVHNFPMNLLKSTYIFQQIRTTFILKRRYDPPLVKKNAEKRKLRAKHFIYDLVENTSVKKKPNMEVVLTTFVEGIGDKGDIVSVKPNFAYEKLLLPGLAVYKTEENLAKYIQTAEEKKRTVHSSPYAQKTAKILETLTLPVTMNKEQPWTIEPWHIRVSLRKAGFHCREECITMPDKPIHGPNMEKENRIFYCTITINNMEKARLRCRLHHWSTDVCNRLPYVPEYWNLPMDSIFDVKESSKDEETKE